MRVEQPQNSGTTSGTRNRLSRLIARVVPDAPERGDWFSELTFRERMALAVELLGWSASLAAAITIALLGIPYLLFRVWLWAVS